MSSGASEGSGMFGVFDGHGGGLASHVLAANLQPRFAELLLQTVGQNKEKKVSKAVAVVQQQFWAKLYRTLEADYVAAAAAFKASGALPPNFTDHSSLREQGREGSTAVVAHVDAKRRLITVSNAGDSRCVLCSTSGRVVAMSNDHKPTDQAEFERLQANGWGVLRGRIYRFREGNVREGGLNLSRAIGDTLYGEGVTCEPDVQTREVALDDELFRQHGGSELKLLRKAFGSQAQTAPLWVARCRRAAQARAEALHARTRRDTLRQDHNLDQMMSFSGDPL